MAYDLIGTFRMSAGVRTERGALDFLPGGEMGALMRATDWTRTPLGPLKAGR